MFRPMLIRLAIPGSIAFSSMSELWGESGPADILASSMPSCPPSSLTALSGAKEDREDGLRWG